VIQGWKGDEAEAIFRGVRPRGVSDQIAKRARRVLAQLNAAQTVGEMASPPGNRLHKVGKDWSVSVNMQFRITFRWGANGPEQVWFGDYH
jgi:proteic killer suppression protein